MTFSTAQSELIETIYCAATDPQAWPLIGQQSGELLRSMTVFLLQDARSPGFRFLTHDLEDTYFSQYVEHYSKVNPLIPPSIEKMTDAVLCRVDEVIRRDEIERTEYYNDWARPQNYYHACGTSFRLSTDEMLLVTFQRSRQLGEHTDEEMRILATLVPHLRRSAMIGQQLERRSTEAASNRLALEQLGFAAFVVNRHGIVSDLNAEAQRLVRRQSALRLQFDRINLATPEQTRSLHTTIQQVIDSRAGTNFVIRPTTLGQNPLNAFLIPTPSPTYWLGNPEAMLLVRSSPGEPSSAIDALRGSFRLTEAETRLLQALTSGETVNGYCERMELSRNTIKTQLKSLFSKTGTSRQADLIRLAASQTMPLASLQSG